jgi:GntR family transcriptional repressor for pyruvate dehydrogenase complex
MYNHRDDYADHAVWAPAVTTTENGTRIGRDDLRSAMTLGRVEHGNSDSRRTLKTSERVALDIVHDIVATGSRTGDHLPLEAEMVEQYHASRASVREALRLLEVQGLIWLKPGPGGGPVVGSVEPANLARTASLYFHLGAANYDQLLRTQAMLEPFCAVLAAQNPDRRQAMQPFLVAAQPASAVDYHRHAGHFHAAVYRLAGNPVISLLTQAITHMVTDHVMATMDPIELRSTIVEDHAVLARAIAGGQAATAGRLMSEHFRVQHEYYRQRSPQRLHDLIEWR